MTRRYSEGWPNVLPGTIRDTITGNDKGAVKMPERCLACQKDIAEERRFKCFYCREWFCLSCIVKHGFCKESGQLDGARKFPGPSIVERVEAIQKRVEEMCSRVEAYFTKPFTYYLKGPVSVYEAMQEIHQAFINKSNLESGWSEVGTEWVECKRHQERFASDTICIRCVEDIIAGGL